MNLGSVLVTGGAGFIGCALADRIAARSDRWVVMDSLHPQVHQGSVSPASLDGVAEVLVEDVTDPEAWDRVLGVIRPEIVIHLAAETGTAQSLDEASRHARVNVVGTTEMLDAFGRNGHRPQHVILSSSRAVYGEGQWKSAEGTVYQPGQRSHDQLAAAQWDFADSVPLPNFAESTIPSPTSVYGATKLAQENILRAWGGARGIPVSVLRLQNVYGPGQSLINSYTGIVSLFSQLARSGKSIPLYEDGLIGRDFVFIDDVADAFAAILEAGPDSLRPILDIGSGHQHTIRDLAHAVAQFYGAPEPVVSGQFRDGDVRSAWANVDRSEEVIGWKPRWSLEAGVGRLQEWIAAQDD